MTLKQMVARLSAGTDDDPSFSNGSAWFINDQYALTALHCVQGEDGEPYKCIALKIFGVTNPIPVEMVDFEKKLDVALLKISAATLPAANAIPILPLARHLGARDDRILMHGHPAQSLRASPDGVSVSGRINDPCHPYNGLAGELDCKVIQCNDISVPALNGSSGLQGISGGPVILDRNNMGVAVIGLVIEDGLNGGYIHVSPVTAIAARFTQVQAALENSTHVNTDDNRICISLAKGGTSLDWSANIPPTDIGQLWREPKQGKYELHIGAKLSELGPAAKALTRLAIYSGVKAIHSPDKDSWAKRFNTTPHPELNVVAAPGTSPAKGQNHTTGDLADIIQAALNNELLILLNDQLFTCLDNNEDCEIGCEIEQQLRDAMWTIWQTWHHSLTANAALLTSFLVRVFSLDGAATINHDALLMIGPSAEVKKQLLHATIYVLAIAAAGISAQPQAQQVGNFIVDKKTGHTSGVVSQNRQRISMLAAANSWRTEIIFLPFLQNKLRDDINKAVALTKRDGAVGYPQESICPIAITADDEFLVSLGQGAQAVSAYYNARVGEVQQQKNVMKLPTRTGALNA